MTTIAAKQPKGAFHPGEILREESLEPGGMTQVALAEQLGWTRARLNELIRGMRGITADSGESQSDGLDSLQLNE